MNRNTLTALLAALAIFFASGNLLAQEQAEAVEKAPTQAAEPSKPASKKPELNIGELLEKSRLAYEEKNWIRFYSANRKLSKLRPYNPEYLYNIVIATAQLDRKTAAYDSMLKLQKQGLSYDFNATEETLPIRGTEAYEYINNLLVEAGKPAGEGVKAFSVDGEPGDFSDIAWDASRERFLIGTRKEGKLLSLAEDGSMEVLLQADDQNGLWAINGVAVDEANKRLWLSSAATPVFEGLSPADLNRGALFEYDLESLEQVGRYNLPVDGLRHELGHLAVTAEGNVYVVDWATPIVYLKTAEGKKLEPFLGSRQLVQLTDIALTPDSSRIFVADAEVGILLIDPKAQQSALLSGPENLNLGGIYNIEFNAGNLVISQSAFDPQRLLRLQLNAAGTAVENVSPMAIALEEFDSPGAGTIMGDKLYYLANQGTQSDAASLLVMATPLEAGAEIKPPDMRQFEEALRQRQSKSQ